MAVKTFLFDSTRWEGLRLRPDDIVIATPAKCGTTWTQRIVSLLIFDSSELYAPMARISPWLDMNTRPIADVMAELDTQTHRRFMKSHLGYAALPHDNGVTYIAVGRDPRDVGVSWMHHIDNVNMENLFVERANAVGLDDLAELDMGAVPNLDGTIADRFWRWVEGDNPDFDSLAAMVNHLKGFWDHRDDPNVVLLHYADLQRDLVGQMGYLAERLGIERSRERLEELAPHAGFDEMKAHAADTAPNGDQTIWKDTTDFFHSGTSGQWRHVVGDDEARYDKRIGELADAAFADWLHHG